ncbi:hypothetical protein EJ06DRAFT_367996 [Trichodelitschia bisporula]|uniref:Uncharacterized protein n=1 Tax=Trichodelitschia bisporula TaxID=703511 RepID=A0A6G1I158_9PEZI|nr:hypothetical protein EJ06DRAFT_367996 [Trichodelitschia bisporula]
MRLIQLANARIGQAMLQSPRATFHYRTLRHPLVRTKRRVKSRPALSSSIPHRFPSCDPCATSSPPSHGADHGKPANTGCPYAQRPLPPPAETTTKGKKANKASPSQCGI